MALAAATTEMHQVDVCERVRDPEDPMVLNAIIFGPPACGKGTQCDAIVNHFGSKHISSGQLLREKLQEPLGGQLKGLKETIGAGELVSSELVAKIVVDELEQDKHARLFGWLLDGFPRTKDQVDMLAATGHIPVGTQI